MTTIHNVVIVLLLLLFLYSVGWAETPWPALVSGVALIFVALRKPKSRGQP